jgi:hypothetical protein
MAFHLFQAWGEIHQVLQIKDMLDKSWHILWIGQDNIHGRWHVSDIGGNDFDHMNETLIVFHNLVETLVGIFLPFWWGWSFSVTFKMQIACVE